MRCASTLSLLNSFGVHASSFVFNSSNTANYTFTLRSFKDISEPILDGVWNCSNGMTSSVFTMDEEGVYHYLSSFYNSSGVQDILCTVSSLDGNDFFKNRLFIIYFLDNNLFSK